MNKYRVFRTVTKILMAQFLWITLAAIGNAENISLQKPTAEGTSFLEAEAGISAYTNVGQTIDLAKARSAFRTKKGFTLPLHITLIILILGGYCILEVPARSAPA